ncbi:MFS transporter [Leucobacter sp. NPDC077196]|uniref:MFS transporter n=1 Tax=Leucobacter sp. NPDC077196 TaxID=3154959 RepID=UPI003418EAB7
MTAQQETGQRSRAPHVVGLVAAGTTLIAATYGLVRLAFGLHLPEMGEEFGLDLTTLGLISAGASLVYGLAAGIGFLVGDRFPRALVLAAGLAAGGGSLGIALTHDAGVFSACAIASSAGAGFASPGLVRIIHRAASPAERSTMQSIVNAGTGPGLVAAGGLAWALAPEWRPAWVVAGGATALATIAVLWLGRAEGGSGAVGTEGRSALHLPPITWWSSHRVALVAAAAFGFGAAAIWNFGRTALVDAGASESASLLAWVLLGFGGAAVIATAPLLRRRGPRSLWLVSTIPAAACTAVLGMFPGSPVLAGTACAVFGWGYVTATGALIEWTTQIDGSRAATGTAVLFVVFMIGQATGAAVVGAFVAEAGYPASFGVAAAVACAAGLLGYERRRSATRSVEN